MNQGPVKACTYKDFSNARPRTFNGTGGVIALKRWIEKVELVFEICECPEGSKVKFTTCTFIDQALSWWNGHIEAMTLPVANSMSLEELKEMLIAEYCPRGEVQKLEQELCNLTVQNSDIDVYISRFNELVLLYPGMITSEGNKVERFIWGLTPPIQGNVIASKPETYDSAKRLAKKLYDHDDKKSTKATEGESKQEGGNKKNWDNKRKGRQNSGPSKKPKTIAVHSATTPAAPAPPAPASTTTAPAKSYAGSNPKCDKCNYHHFGACKDFQCTNCNRKGHTVRYCKMPPQQNKQPNDNNAGASRACYGCGETGHFKHNCPKNDNQNAGRVLSMGQGEAVQDPTVVSGTFPLNNSYACILFNSGAKQSFVSHGFKHLLDQNPCKLIETFTV
ncbi:unnamed protein product [Lactuca virosa]|uniref:CCHC-type domain-containing protein n=1 Tax=Lactuca virosa TaxID=75947 RepID=A0AAU9PN97_9ASTR|nr:unnamed protein product [Lactuca virosa]